MSELEGGAHADERIRANSTAIRLLAVRPRSTRELTDRLARRFPSDVVRLVTQDLTRAGLLDDLAFARQWVTERHRMKLLGRRRLGRELKGLGLESDLIDEALSSLGEEEETAAARELAGKWSRQNPSRSGPAAERSLRDFLARRGYADDVVKQAVQSLYP